MDQQIGKIKIQVLTAGGALPLPRSGVRIFSEEEENRGIDVSLLTDESGICVAEGLPCPPASLSETPTERSGERVYARYRIRVFHDGYQPKELVDAALFETVTTLYICNLVPVGNYENSPLPSQEQQIVISKQNPNL